MKTRIILLICISVLITACSPQVTVTLTPPPTATPIPTPTLHPQFIALQDQIAASGEGFALLPDGTVQDGGVSVPGLQVDPKGVMTIDVNGEDVVVDPSAVHLGPDGVQVDGYELNDDGEWEDAQETINIGGDLSIVLGEKVDGGTLIDKFVASSELTPEQQSDALLQFDETRLGLEGDWVQLQDGRVVLLDDLSDPTNILAEYKIFEQTGTEQVVVDGSKLVVDKENVILSQAEIEEWRGGVPVNSDEVNRLGVEMVNNGIQPIMNQLVDIEGRKGSSAPAGYVLSSDGTNGVSIRYVVLHVDGDQNIARMSPDGIVFFRNSDGGYTYFFVENFTLQYID